MSTALCRHAFCAGIRPPPRCGERCAPAGQGCYRPEWDPQSAGATAPGAVGWSGSSIVRELEEFEEQLIKQQDCILSVNARMLTYNGYHLLGNRLTGGGVSLVTSVIGPE